MSAKPLGEGTFGCVVKATDRENPNIQRAVKIIPKKRIKNSKQFMAEVNILKELDHPNIIKL